VVIPSIITEATMRLALIFLFLCLSGCGIIAAENCFMLTF
jgi:hypothetical protein